MTVKDLILWLVDNASMNAPVASLNDKGEYALIDSELIHPVALDDSRVAILL